MTTHFLDANIFLELNVNDEDYGEFCDTITDHSCDKTTNKRVLREVDDIKAVFLRTFNTLIKFFKKNIKKKRFISDSFIGEKTSTEFEILKIGWKNTMEQQKYTD